MEKFNSLLREEGFLESEPNESTFLENVRERFAHKEERR
jgi:hypothetical protein